jgi:hypothetical protein
MENANFLRIQIRSNSEQIGSHIVSRLLDKILVPEVSNTLLVRNKHRVPELLPILCRAPSGSTNSGNSERRAIIARIIVLCLTQVGTYSYTA